MWKFMYDFGGLFFILKKRGISFKKLARMAGISIQSLRRLRSLHMVPPLHHTNAETLIKITLCLQCGIEDILRIVPLPAV